MGFFLKDCTVSDNEGRSHDIISDRCADGATASSLYFDKRMRLILRRQYEGGPIFSSKNCSQILA